MKVFDRASKKGQLERLMRTELSLPEEQRFSADFIREVITETVIDRFRDIKDRRFPRVLDIGSRMAANQAFSQKCFDGLHEHAGVEELTLLDATPLAFQDAHSRHFRVRTVAQDADFGRLLEAVPEQGFDAVISSLALHWYNDLPSLFSQVRRALKPDGVFIASIYGGKSLRQLREALILAEQERHGGVGLHVSPMAGVADVGGLLQYAGFSLPTVDTEQLTVHYADLFALMEDLRRMGETNAHLHRRLHLSKETLLAAASIFSQLHGTQHPQHGHAIPVTFEVIHLIGWSPHDSQPKSIERGTAEKSLKDL